MGDGADWIKAGVNIINSQDVHVKYASDRFHVFQAIGHITKDKKLQSILLDYVIHNKRKDFNKIVDSILQQETSESISMVLLIVFLPVLYKLSWRH